MASLRAQLSDANLAREKLERELGRGFWECDDCGFRMGTEHTDEDGGYSCPCCAETRLERELAEARAAAGTRQDGVVAVQFWKERATTAEAALAEAVKAVAGLLANYDEERGVIDVTPCAHCPECTQDTTPDSFGRGTCALHRARAVKGGNQ